MDTLSLHVDMKRNVKTENKQFLHIPAPLCSCSKRGLGNGGVTDVRQDNPVYSIKKNPNNLFLCSFFSTLNKSYWTFPDQINGGDREEVGWDGGWGVGQK